ncbi:MAG: amino acid adenylation domain-containing protein, partial [Bacillota bacterium]|nr:amino acid adenylation domain-containing protein [Bacillota bacterium]
QVESLYLHINDRENDGSITLNYDYQADAFYSREIEFIHDHVIRILWHALDNPSRKISFLHMLSEKERQKVLYAFNETDATWPQAATVAELFERQAAARPDATALAFGQSSLTYAELNRQANKIAHRLIAAGAGPEDRIALLAQRSPQLVAGILGIIKAGAAYVPIDPDYPDKRIQYMLDDCGARILLTQPELAKPLQFSGAMVSLDQPDGYEDGGAEGNPRCRIQPNNLLYVIYTSGSTGAPKGVMIEHRQVVRLLFNDKTPFDFGADDCWTLFHSYCFDFSVWEMYGALLYGGKLVIVNKEDAKDSARYLQLLEREQVTVLNQTPAAFYNLIHAIRRSAACDLALRMVIFGGEALKPILLKSFRTLYPTVRLINMYGITETSVHVTWIDLSDADIDKNIGNIGRPIPTSRVYILDKNQNPLPIGIAGEIYVGGAGVARGYLNQPDLTAARFLPDPFFPGENMYRSGDLARFFAQGDLEYLGRIDKQVKIRGHRIELGEVESTILRDSHIREAAVIAGENLVGNRQLWAYYAADDVLDLQDLKTSIALRLPDYMMPACWIKLDTIPLNANGKVDVRRLPVPRQEHFSGREYIAPQNELQQEIALIWQEVLGLDRVGIHDHFFELGGDSLSAVTAVTKMKRGITFAELYQHPTVLKLSEWVNKKERSAEKSRLLLELTDKSVTANRHIICFPYGGGNGLTYRDLADAISRRTKDCHVYAVNLPGHDLQPDAELWPIKRTATKLVEEIKASINGEIILYGHCVGSALAVETAKMLQAEKVPVKTVYLGGSLPPSLSRLMGRSFDPWRMIPDRGIVNYLNRIGLEQAALPQNYLDSMIRSFRHDVRNYYRYFHDHQNAPSAKLEVPVVCIVGEDDPMTTNYQRRYVAWERYADTVKLQQIKKASHYFIKSNAEELATLLTGSG